MRMQQNGATVVATVGGNTYKVNVEAGKKRKIML